MENIYFIILLAICIGLFTYLFFSFTWLCIAFIAKAIAKEKATVNLRGHLLWMGFTAGVIAYIIIAIL